MILEDTKLSKMRQYQRINTVGVYLHETSTLVKLIETIFMPQKLPNVCMEYRHRATVFFYKMILFHDN